MKSKMAMVDNGLILLFCILLLVELGFHEKDVLLILVVCGAKLLTWNRPEDRIHILLLFSYFLIGFYQPKILLFAAFMLYDNFWKEGKTVFNSGSVILSFSLFVRSYTSSYYLLLSFLFSLVLSIYCRKRTIMYEEKEETFTMMQNDSREENLLLEKNNKELIEQQDMSIHLGIANERNRIARDIHDNVGHLLSSALIQIGAIQVINHNEQLEEPVTALKDTVEQGMENIRQSVHGLYDESVDLENSITQLVSKFPNWKIRVDYRLSTDISPEIKVDVIFLVKEALSNVMKHSNATEITLKLVEQPAFYRFEILDNGTSDYGHMKKPRELGIGLSSMEERMKQHNGRLTINRNEFSFGLLAIIPKERELV